MAGRGVRVLTTPTTDLGKILACMHGTLHCFIYLFLKDSYSLMCICFITFWDIIWAWIILSQVWILGAFGIISLVIMENGKQIYAKLHCELEVWSSIQG